MPRARRCVAAVVALAAGSAGATVPATAAPGPTAVAPAKAPAASTAAAALAKLPVRFEANEGQFDAPVRFVAHAGPGTLFLTPAEAVLAVARPPDPSASPGPERPDGPPDPAPDDTVVADVVRMAPLGANPSPEVVGEDRLAGVTNYLVGPDPAGWHTNVASYAKVRYRSVYPGIDLVFYEGGGSIEYDFVVAPGADPGAIALGFSGAGHPTVAPNGDLVLSTASGEVRQAKPVVFQQAGSTRQRVDGAFVADEAGTVRFRLGPYDRARPLVIDPVLTYSTYLGGLGNDQTWDSTADAAGNAYVTGWTFSPNFPTTPAPGTPAQAVLKGRGDAFVAKVNTAASGPASLVYSTYLGGAQVDRGGAIGLGTDAGGATVAWVGGLSQNTQNATTGVFVSDFPTTADAFQPNTAAKGAEDGFVVKLNASGSGLLYSTLLGGIAGEAVESVKVGAGGLVHVAGYTLSTDFPTTAGAHKTICGTAAAPCAQNRSDLFVAKLDTAAPPPSQLAWSTYLGGADVDNDARLLGVDAAGAVYVGGGTASPDFPTTPGAYDTVCGTAPVACTGNAFDGFVAKLNPAATANAQLAWSTFLGGAGTDVVNGGALDPSGNVYVAGVTYSGDFPTTAGALQTTCGGCTPPPAGDAFVARLNPAAPAPASNQLAWSTFLGGPGGDSAEAMALDAAGNVYLAGGAGDGFPVKDPIQSVPPGGGGLVAKLNPGAAGAAQLVYATPLAAGMVGIGLDSGANPVVAGTTNSDQYPTTASAFQRSRGGSFDAVVARLGPGTTPVVSAISQHGGPTTGATPVTLTGSGFAGATAVAFDDGVAPVAATSFNVVSDTRVDVVSPAHAGDSVAEGKVHITVTSPAGVTSLRVAPARYVYGSGIVAPTPACPGNCGMAPVLLATGKVLAPAAGKLYDPATGTWSATATCETCALNGGSATLLANGKVLVAGGNPTNKAFLYDPAAGTWSPTGPMNVARAYHSATLLGDGRVLVAGGCNNNCLFVGVDMSTATAEIYNPASGTWALTAGSLSVARHALTGTLLAAGAGGCGTSCGKVLIAGGYRDGTVGTTFNTAELFDPATGTFAATGAMTSPRFLHTATPLAGGKVLVVGGANVGTRLNSAEVYDPATGTWAPTGSLNAKRWFHSATALANGGVLVTGGAQPDVDIDIAELYDVPSGTWKSATGGDPALAGGGTAVALGAGPASACGTRCGAVLMLGGQLYTPRPAVTAVSPASGPRGTIVTLTGTGLASVDKVSFGSVSTTAVTHDATSPDTILRVNVPAAATAATVNLSATSAGGVSPTGPATVFTVLASLRAVADFNGDGRTDISVFRPSNGGWYTNDGFAAQYGADGDIAVPGDYDGDAKADTAVYRPSVGTWYIHNSATGTDTLLNYGVSSDIPVPADYTGDGRTEVAIYRPSSPTNLAGGTWYIRDLTNGTDTIVTFGGVQGDIPVVGDYDGDAKADRAIFRPSSGGWFVQRSSGGETSRTYGAAGDIPVPADYDGDAKTDVGVYRPSVGTWYLNNSATGADTLLNYGVSTDQVVPGDYNGDSRADIAIYRPTTPTYATGGTWYIRDLTNGTDTIVTFGPVQGDVPLPLPNAIRRFFY